MNTTDDILLRVRTFIKEQFPLADKNSLDDNESLVEKGIIDSMGVLELVTFIESEFEIVLSDEDVISENFESIATITRFIEERVTIGSES